MTNSQDTQSEASSQDSIYNLVWFVEASLSNASRLEGHIADAEREGDGELADFFRKAHRVSRKGGELGKGLLRSRLGSA
jgi:hypothetical protein